MEWLICNFDFFFSCLFWFCFIGWSVAELHRQTGSFKRYRGIKLVLAWSAIFLLWPLALPLFVDSLKHGRL